MSKNARKTSMRFCRTRTRRVIPGGRPTLSFVKGRIAQLSVKDYKAFKKKVEDAYDLAVKEKKSVVALSEEDFARLCYLTQSAPAPKKFADLVFTNDTQTPMKLVRYRLRQRGGSFGTDSDENWITCPEDVGPSTTWHGHVPEGYAPSDDIVGIEVEGYPVSGDPQGPEVLTWAYEIGDGEPFCLCRVNMVVWTEGDTFVCRGDVVQWDLTLDDETISVPLDCQ